MITLHTNFGDINIELDFDKAPISAANFLQYCRDDFYTNTIFHRVIDGFMVQGGGFTPEMTEKSGRASIENEADNGLTNNRGTASMARTAAKDSATSQFFINVKDPVFMTHGSRAFGYAVFGRVINGMDIADAIAAVRTRAQDVPVETVAIVSVRRK